MPGEAEKNGVQALPITTPIIGSDSDERGLRVVARCEYDS